MRRDGKGGKERGCGDGGKRRPGQCTGVGVKRRKDRKGRWGREGRGGDGKGERREGRGKG